MFKFSSLQPSRLLLVIISMLILQGSYAQCESLPEPKFRSYSKISGNWGQLNSSYRFTSVLSGIDAIISIDGKSNASLVSLDLTNTGSGSYWQPQVNIDNQANGGSVGYMDFEIAFVNAGSTEPVVLSEVLITALDVDGDSYRLREGVGFYNVNSFLVDNPTELVAYEGEGGMTIFDAMTVTNQSGISTTATEHMVSVTSKNVSSFVIRCQITADPSYSGTSTAPDRMFAFTFNPCIAENYDTPVSFPVELGEFYGTSLKGAVQLNWSTLTELNNDRFEIQRSDNGRVFYAIGEVAGAGTTDAPRNYEFVDATPFQGASFYRLKQIDFDGQYTYSPVVEMSMDAVKQSLSLWPNPAEDILSISFPAGGEVTAWTLMSMTGQEYATQLSQNSATEARLNLGDLPTGMYFLRVQIDGVWQEGKQVMVK